MSKINIELSLEDSLILLCCNPNPPQYRIASIESLIAEKLDWESLFKVINRHGIQGLIYNSLDKCKNNNLVPAALMAELKRRYQWVVYRNVFFSSEFNRILKKFNDEDIKTVALKGIALLGEVYSDIGLRELSDIDILVKKDEVNRAETILEELGYRREKTYFRFRGKHFHSTFILQKGKNIIAVELHWDFDLSDAPFEISIDDFWNRTEAVQLNGLIYYKLGLEDDILFSSFHIIRDSLINHVMSLKNFCDLAEIIRIHQHKINWKLIIERAQQYKIERPVFLILFLLEELFQISLPENFLKEIKGRAFQENLLNSIIQERIFFKHHENTYFPTYVISTLSEQGFGSKLKNFFKIFKQISVSFRSYDYINSSVMKSFYFTVVEFYRASLNYMKIIYFIVIDYKKFKESMHRSIGIAKEQREIDKWICGNHFNHSRLH